MTSAQSKERFRPIGGRVAAAKDGRMFRRLRTPGKELVSASLLFGGQYAQVGVVNYHHKGACLSLSETALALMSYVDSDDLLIEFSLGRKSLQERHRFRIAWINTETRLMGIEIIADERSAKTSRAPRYRMSRHLFCNVSVKDPTQPLRLLYMRVEDLSMTGMCLSTSLSNAHLLPGMTLRGAILQIPGRGEFTLELYIENTRPGSDSTMLSVGVSFVVVDAVCKKALGGFLVTMEEDAARPEVVKELKEADLLGKGFRKDLTFRLVESEETYKEVVALRHLAYAAAGKTALRLDEAIATAPGLANEGQLLAAYLGKQLVATAELRFESEGLSPRTFEHLQAERLVRSVATNPLFEVNRFAVHTEMHGSDIVLGCMQMLHSMISARGAHDGCVLATEDLVPLYQRIGWQTLDFKTPHPVRDASWLTLMWMPADVYLKSSHVNPLVWERVYGETHRFQSNLSLVGDLQTSPSYVIRLIWGWISIRANEYFLRRRRNQLRAKLSELESQKRRGEREAQGLKAKSTSGSTSPLLTKPHLHVSVVAPYLKECDALWGAARTESILNEIGLARVYFEDHTNWVSVAFLDEFLDHYSQFADTVDLSIRAARRVLSRHELGLKWFALKILTPQQAFAQVEKLLPKFNRTRTYKILFSQPGMVRLAIGLKDPALRPAHEASCANFKESFASYVHMTTGERANVDQLESIYEGSQSDVYEIQWNSSRQGRRKVAGFFGWQLVAASLALGATSFQPQGDAKAWLALLCLVSTNLVWAALTTLRLEKKASQALSVLAESEESSHRKYIELQSAKESLNERFREATLLEQMSHRLQELEGVDDVVSFALKSICSDFEFDRAFLMLLDSESKSILKTVAIEGFGEVLPEVWSFNVDVSVKRENSQLLSSVYHSGEPVIIDDVEKHLFQLNGPSRTLVRKLKTKGFVIVPIRSEKVRWGVIIADRSKIEKRKPLARHDVHLLQRVAQTLALALDQERRVEEQRSLRTLFERYVPSDVISTALARPDEGYLGGTQRIVTSMFFDVRNFTETTERMSPVAVVSFVNRIFSDVEEIVRSHGGRVDKFLGDGLLAVWGSLSDHPDGNAPEAVNAALALLAERSAMNLKLSSAGFPQMKFGLGLHTGPALVGHVGGERRCEFTCMGPSVNMASRLEGLCKSFETPLIISEECFASSSMTFERGPWSSADVQLKGFSESKRIFYIVETL